MCLPLKNLSSLDRAAAVRFDKRFDVSKYVRSGMHLQKVADLLYKDKKLEESFVYYMRFAIMFVQILPKKHPHYDKLSVDLRHTIKQSLKVIVPRCEEIKGLLLAQYEKQYQVEVEHARRKEEEASKSAAAAAADTAAAALTRLSVSDAAAEKDATADGSVDDLQWPNVASPSAPSDANDVPTSSGAAPSAPSVNRSIKPAMTSSPSVFGDLETSGFRRVLIPRTVISTFLDIAAVCTSHGVEMCGILTGKLNAEGDYQLTHLIIPKQEGTPDSCNAVGEESLAEYQIAHDLLTLGWIHVSVPMTRKCQQLYEYRLHLAHRRIRPKRPSFHRSTCTRRPAIRLCFRRRLLSFALLSSTKLECLISRHTMDSIRF